MTVWLQDSDVTLYHGDALETLRELPARSVHMCATSPPFYGLRDYGTDGQIGLEETPDQWVDKLIQVFREVRRVLRDDGTLWVEIGDSYAGSGPNTNAGFNERHGHGSGQRKQEHQSSEKRGDIPVGTKQKDLIGQPWLLAFALRADGWYLRSEIIWARPNPMPESVTDRPTKSHSTIFLLSKNARYYYDQEASREGLAETTLNDKRQQDPEFEPTRIRNRGGRTDGFTSGSGLLPANPAGRNGRSVWTIPTEPTPYAHFATWPQQLVRRMILAGTSQHGCCPECGAPWERQIELGEHEIHPTRWGDKSAQQYRMKDGHYSYSPTLGMTRTREQTGWRPSCGCGGHGETDASSGSNATPLSAPAPIPCTVLDPFAGSGTTCLVARNHQRHSIGIELNEQYLQIAAKRLAQLSLLA